MKVRTRIAALAAFIMLLFCFYFYGRAVASCYSKPDLLKTTSELKPLAKENQTIHIVLLVVDDEAPKQAGISVCERVETLLKSILIYYPGKLHVHLLTSTRSGKILGTLFRTWPLSRVLTSIYNVDDDQKSLAWVKSTHEVSGYGQLKYVIHDILPNQVEKAIFIDTDMLVLEDLSILHGYFSEMERKGTMFAATSDQYGRKDLEKSLGRGASRKSVNSGLLLYNLKAMRSGGWTALWRAEGVRLMNKLGKLVCPQDLLAAVAIARPDTYLKLPCVYNFQIGKGALLWDCVKKEKDLRNAKIPHWTSKNKYYQTAGHTAVFAPIYRCFQKMDGYVFEKAGEKATKHRTLLNIWNTKRDEKEDDVTLAAHVNYEEAIDVIQRLNETWLGPISLSICGDSWERAQLLSFIFSNTLHDLFDVHFIYRRGENCPIEYLRRVAIDATRTDNILVTDTIASVLIDEDLRTNYANKTLSNEAFVLKSNEAKFAGVLLERSYAQRLAAGTLRLDIGLKAFRLKLHEIEVDSTAAFIPSYNVTKWELDMPTESFCQEEIDWRRSYS